MKRPSLLFIILVLSFIQIATVFGQSFPVQIVPQAIPPTPVYFSSYANETAINGPLRVQITLNDLTIQNRGIRLRASFEGNGISFQSNEIVNGAAPLFLEGGLPLVLNNIDLAPYFRFENITGISPNVYGQPIPEGTYQFCFEVFDVLTGNRLSNRSCVNTVVFQNDPPILVSPQNRTIVEQVNPQNIVFQWTPRHINVSNVEYELSLVEIWDNQIDHQAAFLSSPPFFTTVTTATTYVYGPSDPLLLPDKNYAWRVQARAMQGAEEIGVFNNQGFSEIYVFGSTTRCELPSTVTDEVKGATNANILWTDFSQDPAEYSIRYRQKDSGGEWFYSKTTGEMITLWDLKPGTEYEYQLSKKCVLSESEYSTIQTFRTNLFDDDDSTYECGIAPNIDVSNQVPLENLEVDEKFTAGDFPVTVLEVNGGNGYFNGKGYVTIPYLKSIKVAVEFTNIFINQNKELAQGNVVTVYDPNLGGIIDPWDIVDDIGDAINGGDHTYIEPVDFDIDKVEIRDGEIVVIGTDENGNPVEETFPYDEGDTYTITGNNQVWGIDENGKAEIEGATAEGGAAVAGNTTGVRSGSDGTLDSPAVVEIEDSLVSFTYSFPKKSEESYGHDVADSPHEKNTYPKVKLSSGGDFYPIHKAVKNGASDTFIVEATFKNDSLSIDSLIFKTVQGLAIETEVKDRGKNQIKVTVSGHKGYRSQEAVITYKTADDKQVVVSSFFIHHLRPLERTNVTLVPVNGASISGIKAQVAQKFNEGGAQLNVIDGSPYTGNTSELEYTETGLLRRHPRSFIDFYQNFKANSGQYNDNSYYVFVFDEDVQPGTIAGFMPRNSQFGFVFPINLNTTKLESKRTVADLIAHEVGHGVFALSHPEGTGGQTNWLMDDKGPGNELAIRDWEAMGFDGLRINLFDDDEEGESAVVSNIEALKDFQNDDGTYTFITSSGKPITLPENITSVRFSTGDKLNRIECPGDLTFTIIPFGVLSAFKIGDVDYTGRWSCESGFFAGYSKVGNGNDYYNDSYTNETIGSAITGIPTVDSRGNIVFMIGKIPFNPISTEPGYKGSGDYKEYDFLVEQINKISFFKELYASFEPKYSEEVRQFIVDNIDERGFDGTTFYDNDAYVFIHATQLEHYAILKGCFKNGVPGEMLKFITQYESDYRPLGYGAGGSSSGYKPVFKDTHEPNAQRENINGLINHWRQYDINYYPIVAEAVNNFRLPEDASADDIINLFKDSNVKNEIHSDNWDCFWDRLDIDDRKQIIKTFADAGFFLDGYFDLDGDSEHVLIKLFKTTKEADRQELLNFINNYNYLEYIFDSLDYNKQAIYFVEEIYGWLREFNPEIYANDRAREEAYAEFDIWYNNINYDNNGSHQYYGVDSYKIIGSNWFNQLESGFSKFRSSFNETQDGTFDFYHHFVENNNDGSQRFAILRGNLAPFEPVFIYLADDEFTKYSPQLTAGTYGFVPAIYLHWLVNARRADQNETAFRVGMNVLAIALAPLTAGGSTIVLLIEVAAATIDIYMALNEDELRAKYGDGAITLWNATYGLYNFYQLGKGFGQFFKFNTKKVDGVDKVTSMQLQLDRLDELAENLIQTGDLERKTDFLNKVDELLTVLKTPAFANLVNKRQMFEKLLEVRFKVERTLGDFTNIIVDNTFLVVKNQSGGNLAVAKIDFIDNVPNLTGDIRWLDSNKTPSTQIIAQFDNIGFTQNGIFKVGKIEIVEDLTQLGQFYIRVVGAGINFYKTGAALRAYLNTITNLPKGTNLTTDLYRSLNKSAEQTYNLKPNEITPHTVYSSWGRYDLDGAENALYLSKTLRGNKEEIAAYGAWENYSAYKFPNVDLSNFLDLTDSNVINALRVSREQLIKVDPNGDKSIMYEFTNEIAAWARTNGYSGIIAPGARGTQDYKNIVLFTENAISQIQWFKISKVETQLILRGVSDADAEEIAIRILLLDDKIGNNLFADYIGELAANSGFKNPEDILGWLTNSNVDAIINASDANMVIPQIQQVLNQVNEIQVGLKYLRQGEEVYISKQFGKNIDEIDVRIQTGPNRGIVECKRVSGGAERNVIDRIIDIKNKFTEPGKLSNEMKIAYPKHIGQISISNGGTYQTMDKLDFMGAIRNSLDTNLTLEDLRVMDELHVSNNTGDFVILKSEW